MNKDSKIYLAGHKGLVGSAILKTLQNKGYQNLLLKTYSELDLSNQIETAKFFQKEKPEYVILAAAKVGGIMANNTYRAEFIYENLMIQNNVIHQSYLNGVKKLLFLGSSCIYPKEAHQPIKEDALLTSDLEYTNEPYAIAKIAGIKMCESYNLQYGTNFMSVMPTNLYGFNDNYDLDSSHVLPALLRKFHLGKYFAENNFDKIIEDLQKRPLSSIDKKDFTENELIELLSRYGITKDTSGKITIHLWGTGKPMREFLHAQDMAEACVFLMENIDFADVIKNQDQKQIKNTHINIGSGTDLSISDLANLVKDIVGFTGELKWDATKPDGTFRKLLDVSKLNSLCWKYKISLQEGIRNTYKHYQEKSQ